MTREDAAIDYCLFIGNTSLDEVDAFEAGVEWAEKALIDKASNWLIENFYNHPHEQRTVVGSHLIFNLLGKVVD